jgi:hypothetical protein
MHPLSLYLPSHNKFIGTLQLRGQIHSPYLYSTLICTQCAHQTIFVSWTNEHLRARICTHVSGAHLANPPAYMACRAGTSNRVVVPACHTGNRFLGSLKGLQIRAQHIDVMRNTYRAVFKKLPGRAPILLAPISNCDST